MPGHVPNYLSIAGALGLLGENDRPRIIPSNIIADMAGAAMHSLAAILIALLAREKTGQGQFINISHPDAVFSLLAAQTATYFLTGIPPRRGEHMMTGSEPFMANYKTKHGRYLSIACLEPWLWKNLCQALGCEHFIPHQWARDRQKKEEIFSFLGKIFLTKTRDKWWEWAKNKDIAVAPVLDLEEAFDDPQIRHRKMLVELEHPDLGKVRQLGAPFKLSDTPPRHTIFSPTHGEHTNEILVELGYDQEEIEALRKNGVI